MKAGAATVDITPLADIHHTLEKNYLTQSHWRVAIDPLHAQALVLDDGKKNICIIAVELNAIDNRVRDELRAAAAERCGIEPNAVMCHAHQNHSCPQLGYIKKTTEFFREPKAFWDELSAGDDRYREYAVERIISAVEQANANLQPAKIGVASGVEGRVAFNRRMITKDGGVSMPLFMDRNDYRYMEGPMDPELGVVSIRGENLQPLALLLNYTAHPVNLHPERMKHVISADWPGAWANEMKALYGDDCTPLVLNGACGNINPWDPWDPDFVRDHKRMGKILGRTAELTIDDILYTDDVELDFAVSHVTLPWHDGEGTWLESAQKYMAENPEPIWADETHTAVDNAWTNAAWRLETHLLQEQGDYEYEIQILRIGDTAIVGLPGEPFVEAGLEIKLASPAAFTYVVHLPAWPDVSYLPTQRAFGNGGYEIYPNVCRIAPGALEKITAGAIDLLNNMFA
jgi:neutral ceramidase